MNKWWVVLAALAGSLPAGGADIVPMIMGQLTYPAGAGIVDSFHSMTARNWRDPQQDTFKGKYEFEYGLTDECTVAVGLKTLDQVRDQYQVSRLILEFKYLGWRDGFQWAPFVEILPSLLGKELEWETGFDVMAHLDRFSPLFTFKVEGKWTESGLASVEHRTEAWGLYRFGIHGLVGLGGGMGGDGSTSINAMVGGSISQNLFLAMRQEVGIIRPAPDYRITLELHFYVGPFRWGGWGL